MSVLFAREFLLDVLDGNLGAEDPVRAVLKLDERIFRFALLVFVVASLGCCFSHSLFELTAARIVQGLAGAAMTVSASPRRL